MKYVFIIALTLAVCIAIVAIILTFSKSPTYPIHITDPGGEVVERLPIPRVGLVMGIDTSQWESGTDLVLDDNGGMREATAEELEYLDSVDNDGYVTKIGTVRDIKTDKDWKDEY